MRVSFVNLLRERVSEKDGLFSLWVFLWDLLCFRETCTFLNLCRAQDVMLQSLCSIGEHQPLIVQILNFGKERQNLLDKEKVRSDNSKVRSVETSEDVWTEVSREIWEIQTECNEGSDLAYLGLPVNFVYPLALKANLGDSYAVEGLV